MDLSKLPGFGLVKPAYRRYRRILVTHQRPFDTPQRWKEGLAEELGYWDIFLDTKGAPDHRADFVRLTDPAAPVTDPLIIERLSALAKAEVSILDVGAGPLSCVGMTYPGKTLRITAVDPLGREYQQLLAKYNIVAPVTTSPCEAEKLLDVFGRDRFDIAYARNCLDHAYDPIAAVRAMLKVIRSDGVVLLRHKVQEAESLRYWGLHQWNFEERAGHLMVWSRGVQRDISSAVDDLAASGSCQQEGVWVTCAFSRT